MDRIESLIDMEENEEYGGVRWENPEQGESEVNANQVMIDTMKFMVAKLENMSMRIDGLEDSLSSPRGRRYSSRSFKQSVASSNLTP